MTKSWDRFKVVILDLYKQQGKPLAETKKIMEEVYDFKASTRAYRCRLKKWEVTKYSTAPRRGSAPAESLGSVGDTHAMPVSTPMTPSRTYPGAAGPLRTRPDMGPSHVLAPYPSDTNFPQLRDDTYGSSNVNYSNAVSPQGQVNDSPLYFYPPSLPQHQQQQPQQSYFPQRGYHVDIQPEHHQMNGLRVLGQNQTHQAALRPHLAITEPHQPQPTHSRPEPDANACLDTLATLLSPDAPTAVPTPPVDADQHAHLVSRNAQQLAMLGRLDDRFFRVAEAQDIPLTALEFCVLTYKIRHHWSPRFLCQLCAALVRYGASTTRLVPLGLATAVRAIVHGQGPEQMKQLFASHQQQYGAILFESPWNPIWLSACELHLRGDEGAVNEHLCILARQYGLQHTRSLLPLPPELSDNLISPVSLQNAPDIWSP